MKNTWKYWWLSLGLAISCLTINGFFFRVPDILKIQFAPGAQEMSTYILKIVPDSMEESYHILLSNTITDYVFIIAYSLLTFFSLKILLSLFDVSIGSWVYIVSIITGLMDCMENNFLMNAAIRQREEFSCLYFYIVRVKWAFAIIPISFIPVVLVYGLMILLRNRQNDRISGYNL